MKRLAAALLLLLACAPSAAARGSSATDGPLPFKPETVAPTNLHAFLLRPDEAPAKYYPRTPSFAWDPVSARGGSYEFELATSRSFSDSAILFSYKDLTIPAVAVDHQLPWMTGVPYALWAHVRWVSSDGKKVTPWSQPHGFNVRWADSDYPQQLPAPPGLIRWQPIEGATAYEVLYPDIRPSVAFTTTTNVADEREFFTLHDNAGWGASIRWRVRAVRYINDKDTLANGLPRVTYGPWSKTFTSVNPPASLGVLAPTSTISDTWDKAGSPARPHELTPAFTWTPTAPVESGVDFGSSLYRIYIFTDDHCVNRIFTGSIVGTPAFAPRTQGGPLSLPQNTTDLRLWMGGKVGSKGGEGNAYDATGKAVQANEIAGTQVGSGTGSTSSGSSGSSGSSSSPGSSSSSGGGGFAGVDLWDSGWPTGRYYWTVVPVTVGAEITAPSSSTDPNQIVSTPVFYQDTEVPQDACESGRGMSFGKVSSPVVTSTSSKPFVAGLAPSGRMIASAKKVPALHDSPLVAWEPAVGATQYEIQVSRKRYPWVAVQKTQTYSTATVLPLKKKDVGTWWYRVRGINPALPSGAQNLSWSAPVKISITGDQFVVVK